MIVAIMQPYFFPYIGYFQLMKAVDCFIFYDDVQYINRGWVNRNRVLLNGNPIWLTFPVEQGSRRKRINQRNYVDTIDSRRAIEGKISSLYAKAPFFEYTFDRIGDYLNFPDKNVAAFNRNHLIALAGELKIDCEFLVSSQIPFRKELMGQDRIIDVCRSVGASHYLNPVGGTALYDDDAFRDAGIELGFLAAEPTCYRQFSGAHVPFLSIIDVLMFNGRLGAAALLGAAQRHHPHRTTAQ